MRAYLKTLKPGQKGTRELLTRYGLSLLCVRYRYADDTRESLKTVELVVQRRSREREAEYPGSRKLDGRVGSAADRLAGDGPADLLNRVVGGGG